MSARSTARNEVVSTLANGEEPRRPSPRVIAFVTGVFLFFPAVEGVPGGADSTGGMPDRVQRVDAASKARHPEQMNVYDADPHHLWNRVFYTFYSRDDVASPEGWRTQTKPELRPTRMGPDVLDPP